ncbi:scavenger receptor class B member 1 isoform X2 [Paroedura picta]|uniref:scavenger receptor class B member 1 isoform X2 n=1 Tax=Paroedura picta TaxID=143630 RepID=UPI0040568918
MGVGAPRRALVVCGALGGGLLLLGLVLVVVLPGLVELMITQNVQIRPNSFLFNLWKDLPIPFHFSVYFFHVLNPNAVLQGEKPVVEQRGPYVYREFREKRNITFYENGSVSFLEYRRFYFQPDLSNGTEEDYVCIPNLLVLGAAVMLEDLSAPLLIGVSAAFTFFKQKAFLNQTVGEILWGYEEGLIKFLNAFKPGFLPFTDKFGIFLNLNNTHMGRFTVNTGVRDISKVQMVENWNGLKKVSYWNSDQCNMINGTSGEIWPPFRTPSEPLEFYSTDVCRSLQLEYKEMGDFQGIPVYHYVAPKTLFANGTEYPPNEGFCPCRQSGIQNISSCQMNAPIFLSQPHFLNGDPELVEAVEGLHPNERDHDMFMDMHALTGVPMNVSVKLQLSLYIKRVPFISQTGRISPVVLPMLWFEERGMIGENIFNKYYDMVVLLPAVMGYIMYCIVGLGGCLLILTAFLLIRSKEDAPKKALPTEGPQNGGPQDPSSTPLLKKDLNPSVPGDD